MYTLIWHFNSPGNWNEMSIEPQFNVSKKAIFTALLFNSLRNRKITSNHTLTCHIYSLGNWRWNVQKAHVYHSVFNSLGNWKEMPIHTLIQHLNSLGNWQEMSIHTLIQHFNSQGNWNVHVYPNSTFQFPRELNNKCPKRPYLPLFCSIPQGNGKKPLQSHPNLTCLFPRELKAKCPKRPCLPLSIQFPKNVH